MSEATPGREAALAWLKRNFQMGVTSSLPRNEEGEVIWELAGPMMQREWPAMKFAVIYLTGIDEQMAEALAARVLNEWHGLKADTGLEDISAADLKPEEDAPGPDDELRAYLSDLRGLVARIKAHTAWANWTDEDMRTEIEGWRELVRDFPPLGATSNDREPDAGPEEPVRSKHLVKFAVLGAVLIALAWLVVWVTI